MSCNCNEESAPLVDCSCKVRLNSDCITVSGIETACSGIADNLILTDYLTRQDAYVCSKFDTISGFTTLKNVGTGAEVYKGVDSIGRKEIRRIKSSNNSVTITQNTNDIDLSVVVPNGSETKINAGTNVTITGLGSIGSPYIVNNSAPDQTVTLTQGGATTITGIYPNFTVSSVNTVADGSETKINAGTNVTITGNGTVATPYIVNSTGTSTDGSETKVNSGVTTVKSGLGTTASPYVIEVVNLQKVITYPTDFTGTNYTLTNADNNYEIIINNGTTAVTITVPSGLTSKIGVGFTQKGTADVSYVASGTTINNPIGLKIKGQYYQTYLSQELGTNIFYLGGNTKS